MNRYGEEKINGNYIELKSPDVDNLYLVNGLREHNIRGNIKKDVYGRTEKIFKYFDKYDIIVDSVLILDKNSRKSKIDSFLSSLYDDVTESMKINLGTLNYDIEIILEKNSKGISNVCRILKNDKSYKEYLIKDFDKDIKYISKLINKDKFNFKELIKSYLLDSVKYTEEERSHLQYLYDEFLYKWDKIKWNTCFIDCLKKDDTRIELVLQKGKMVLQVDCWKYSSRKPYFKYPSIKRFNSINQSYVSCDTYTSLEDALKDFKFGK
jgi:hypothetical protein